MGCWSWTCPHCDMGLRIPVDQGINEWMNEAVVLSPPQSRYPEPFFVRRYEGYGICDAEGDKVDYNHVIAHIACWEMAGKPDFSQYERPSRYDPDQGIFGEKEQYDIIDPRITDPGERERRLTEGRALRERRQYNQKASNAYDMFVPSFWRDEEHSEPWRRRYRVSDATGLLFDRLTEEYIEVDSSLTPETEAVRLWNEWKISSELQTLLAYHRARTYAGRADYVARLRREGRYVAKPHNYPGLRSPGYVVFDQVEHVKVISVLPRELLPEDMEALATEEAQRLNEEWARDGYSFSEDLFDPLPDLVFE